MKTVSRTLIAGAVVAALIVPASGVSRSTGSSVGMRGGSSSLCEGRKSNRAATGRLSPSTTRSPDDEALAMGGTMCRD